MNRKIRYKRLILFLVFVLIFVFILIKLFSLKITNIYIQGNVFLSDQEVIEIADLQDYPRALFTFSGYLESKIKKNDFIKSVNVRKKWFTSVYINVVENKPLFFDEINKKTVLSNGIMVSNLYNVPSLINNVKSDIYDEFLLNLSRIDSNVYENISDIEYCPNDVDAKRFLFYMNDGNYVYVNLDKFVSVNKYYDMVVNFNNHKGILYLDSGEYFKILDN